MRLVQVLALVFFSGLICVVNSTLSNFDRFFHNPGRSKDVKVTLYGRVFCAELERQNASNSTSHTRHRRDISLDDLYSAHGYSSVVRSDDDSLENSETVNAVRKQPGSFFRSYGFEDSDEGDNVHRHLPRHPPPHHHNSWEQPQRQPPRRPQHHEQSHWDTPQSQPRPQHHSEQASWKPRPSHHHEEVTSGHTWDSSSHRPDEHHEEVSWGPTQSRPSPPQHHENSWKPSHSPSQASNSPSHHGESEEWMSEPRPEPKPRPQPHGAHSTNEDDGWSENMESRPKPPSSHSQHWSAESEPQSPPKPHHEDQEDESDWHESPRTPSKPAAKPRPTKPTHQDSWEDKPMPSPSIVRPPTSPPKPTPTPSSWESSSENQATNQNAEESVPIPDSWESVPSRSPSKPIKTPSASEPQQHPRIPQSPIKPRDQVEVWSSNHAPILPPRDQSEEAPSNAVPTGDGNSGSGRPQPLHNQPNDQSSSQAQSSSKKVPHSAKLPPTTEAEMSELKHSRGKGGWDHDSFVASGAGLTRAELEAKKRADEQNEESGDAPKFAQAISRRTASRRWRRSAAVPRSSSTARPKIKMSPAKNAIITVYQPKSLGSGFVVNEPIGQVETDEDGYFYVDVVLSDYFMNVVLPMRKPYFTVSHTCEQSSERLEEPCRYVSYLPLFNERDFPSTSLISDIEPNSEVSKVVILGMENEQTPTSKQCPFGTSKNNVDFLHN